MGSLSRSPGAQGRGVPPRVAARYHGDQAAGAGVLDFPVNVRSAAPPSWLLDGLFARHGRRLECVLGSMTKTWPLAGLRVGYALDAPGVLARLASERVHWPLGTRQLEALR